MLLALVLFVQSVSGTREAPGAAMTYSEFVGQVNERNVQSVAIATTANGNAMISGRLTNGKSFRTIAPYDAKISDRLVDKGVAVQVKAEEATSLWLYMLYNSLPFLLDDRHRLLHHAPDAEE